MEYHILHIEDSKTDADLVQRIIQRSGMSFTYQLAMDKTEAINALKFFEPNVILCDHSLPTLNSKMAYALCKEKNPDLPFILVTGTVSEEFAVEMLKIGVDDYLLKSNLQRLPAAITNALFKKETDKKIQSFRVELNKSETHLRTIFENSDIGLVLLDQDCMILELNDRTKYYNRISFGRELVKNENLLNSLPAYRREEMQSQFQKSLLGEKVQYESVYPQQDGSIITFDVKLSPTIDQEGTVTGTCMAFEDISEQKRAEQLIKYSEKKYRNLIEKLPEAIYTCDADGYIQLYNSAAVNIWGREPVAGKDRWSGAYKILNKDGNVLPHEASPMAICLKEGKPVHGKEILIERPDESLRYVLQYPSPLFSLEGELTGAMNMLLDVTDKKEREILIQKTEEKYRNIIEQASDAILIFSFDGTIHEFNKACYSMLGYSREEYAKLRLTDILVDDIIVDRDNYATILEGGTTSVNRNLMRKDGSLLQTEITVKQLADGKVIAFARDITEREKAAQALKGSEMFTRTILTSIDYHIAVLDANGNIMSVNEAWNNFSIQNGEAALERTGVGSNYISICEAAAKAGDSNSAKALLGFQQVLNKELPFFEMEYPCHSAFEQRWFLLRIVNFADDTPKVVMMHIDITELTKAGQKLKSLTNRLLLATTSAGMGIWDWDIQNNDLLWDEGMYNLYDIDNLSFGSVYDGWLSRLHEDDRVRVNNDMQLAVAGKKKYDTEFRIIWHDQSVHYLRATGITESDSSGKVIRVIGVNWDVTANKLAEIQLQELNENLQKNVKQLALSNEELEQFAFVASHDLQEPLRMITSFLTQLEKKYGDVIDEKGKQYIGFAVDGAKRMRHIILDLLEFSRVGKMEEHKVALDLNELLTEIKMLLRKKIQETKAVILIDPLPQISIYLSPLRQVFQNLISNALMYSSKTIPVRIQITVKEFKDHYQFAVIDNGIGIGKEYFDKIFIIFQRLHHKDEYGGTGMGLAVTKKIIENLGGKIWVESEEGKGSRFYFTVLK